MAVIYIYTNKTNGKSYVGQTWYPDKRHRWHLNSKNGYFHKSLRKYGEESFIFSILLDGIEDQETLDEAEQYMIFFMNTLVPNGYNLVSGGRGTTGPSNETRQKMSISARKKFDKSPELKTLFIETMKSEKSNTKRKKTLLTMNRSKEWKDKCSSALKKYRETDEGKKTQSRVNMILRSSDVREKAMIAYMETIKTDEWKRSHYSRLDKLNKDEEIMKKRIDALRKKKSKRVMCIQNQKEYESLRQAAKELNISSGAISNMLLGKRKSVKGFTFKVIEKNDRS